jgi:hypothetical protein
MGTEIKKKKIHDKNKYSIIIFYQFYRSRSKKKKIEFIFLFEIYNLFMSKYLIEEMIFFLL